MQTYLTLALCLACCAFSASAAPDAPGPVSGTLKKIGAGAKTVAVKTAGGAEETFHVAGRTVASGVDGVAAGAKATFHSVKAGSEVAAHYTAHGAEKTADEIGNIGDDGLTATQGAAESIGHGAKTIGLKTADGAEETYHLADRGARIAGNAIADGAEKSAHATVYYTEEAGRKVAHFVKRW